MYTVMKKLIEKRFYTDVNEVTDKLDVFFALNRLNGEQYAELILLAQEVYA